MDEQRGADHDCDELHVSCVTPKRPTVQLITSPTGPRPTRRHYR